MKFAQRFLLIATATAALATCSFAQSPVGTWKGKVLVDTSKMQKLPDASQQAMLEKNLAATRAMSITIVMKADKTYTADAKGGPNATPPDSGTWSVKGNQVTMTSSKKDSQGKAHPQSFTLSSDGKTMSFAFPPTMGIVAKIVLKR